MNIFYLDTDPIKAANMLNDKHTVKMIVESTQMLTNAYYVSIGINNLKNLSVTDKQNIDILFKDFPFNKKYKVSFMHHPCSKWVCESLSNWNWLLEHAFAISEQYTLRYQKIHKSKIALQWMKYNNPNIVDIGLTPVGQAMPDSYKNIDPVIAYQTYYLNDKKWSTWKLGLYTVPDFWKNKYKILNFDNIQLTNNELQLLNIKNYITNENIF